MKVKREKLIEMYHLFNRLGDDKCSVKFHFRVLQNKRRVESEMNALQEANKPLPEFQEFETERMNACSKFCAKDDKGKNIIKDNNYEILEEDKDEFQKTLDELKEKYKETLDKAEERNSQFLELLQEEVEIDFYRFKIDEMPESILGSDLEIMYDLVDEE